jgi:hypothetical protein
MWPFESTEARAARESEQARASAVERSRNEAARARKDRKAERETSDAAMAQRLQDQEFATANDADLARRLAAQPDTARQPAARAPIGGSMSGLGGCGSAGAWSSLQPPPLALRSEDMVHVACEIGGTAAEMLVDTGAQTSVISAPLVQQLRLDRSIDARHAGVAAGVGTARILGRLPAVPVRLGHVECHVDFSVLELQQPLLMLGLDQLKRFKCIVDLERSVLVFGGAGGVEVPFLAPSQARPTLRGVPELACPQQ